MKLSTMGKIVTAAQISLNHVGRDNIQERQISADMLENMLVEVEMLLKGLHIDAEVMAKYFKLIGEWADKAKAKATYTGTLARNAECRALSSISMIDEFFKEDMDDTCVEHID